jgi:hypothetical protein
MEPVGQPFKLPNLCEMAQHPANLRRGHRQLPRGPLHVHRPRRTLRGYLQKAAFDLLAISVPCPSSLLTECRSCAPDNADMRMLRRSERDAGTGES